jgi:hypothetical protein
MGFSALDGLPMGTRPGALDPGVLLYLVGERSMTAAVLEKLLYKESGLLGISGVSNDMRLLLESREPRARLAVDFFVYRVAREIGALAASLGGVDGLVFTAGIGENSAEIRARVVAACAWLGIALDADANRRGGPRISPEGSAVSAWVVPTNEELMIARHTLALVAGEQRPDRSEPLSDSRPEQEARDEGEVAVIRDGLGPVLNGMRRDPGIVDRYRRSSPTQAILDTAEDFGRIAGGVNDDYGRFSKKRLQALAVLSLSAPAEKSRPEFAENED